MTRSICSPVYATPRTPSRKTRSGELQNVARELGYRLYPHQKALVDVGLEVDSHGIPFYREVMATWERQTGKTVTMLAWMLFRALLWSDRPQLIVYGAQDGLSARKRLLDDWLPIIQRSPLSSTIKTVRRVNGAEAYAFKNGSRIEVMGSSETAVHGRAVDCAVMDELFADRDERRLQALIPAMSTKADAQLLVISTAGDDKSVVLNRKMDAGRTAVNDGARRGLAYHEYAAPSLEALDDSDAWPSFHPGVAYGLTSIEIVQHARQSMNPLEFARAYGNLRTSSSEEVIPEQAWADVLAPVAPSGGLVFGVDANPDRTFASITVVDSDGRCELGHYGAGIAWLAPRAIELAKTHKAPVAVNSTGPAGSIVPELERAGVKIVRVDGADFVKACSALYDAIADQTIAVRDNEIADQFGIARKALRRRPVGDSWVFTRKDTTADISPFIALTVAVWARANVPKQPKQFGILL